MAKKSSKAKNDAPSFREEALSAPLLEKILREVHKPLRLDDFLRVLALPRRQKKTLEHLLHGLLDSGRVVRLGGGSYALATSLKKCVGILSMHRTGVGFVKLDPPGKGGVFIAPQHLEDGWHGDRVEVAIFPGRRGKNQDGRITRIIERAVKELPVRVVRLLNDGTSLCESMDGRNSAMFQVDCAGLEQAPVRHSLLRIRPEAMQGPGLWTATALAVLGGENDAGVQEELVKANHAIPRAFPPGALKEAGVFPRDPDARSLEGRRDLAHLPFVTIDGASARDFDDAIYVEKTRSGYLLYVAIADVAHYVRPKSALDDEALLRGNSYYFPRSVEPMLPEALSNGLCSLNPHTPRLVMVAEIAFSTKGELVREQFYPASIISAARLTYDQVRDGLILGLDEARQSLAPNLPMLEQALALTHILTDTRKERGCLDFDLPEPECRFDDAGDFVSMVPRENHFAHKLIEEFMVAANEAVARFLTARDIPLLYRVHPAPDPDKLSNLFQVLASTGLLPPEMAGGTGRNAPAPSSKQLQRILDSARGTPYEYLVSRVALRSMMQAGYTQDLDGHFGLASTCYCHFTSPIRRYADLVVHRALKAALESPDKSRLPGRKNLQAIADHINSTERTAMEAEREIYRRMGVIFMHDHVGEVFSGIISGLTEFGMFVELDGTMTEGMVRLAALDDDYYVHYPERQELRGERFGRSYRLGQAVQVSVTDVNMARLEINLAFVREKDARGKTKVAGARSRPGKGGGSSARLKGKKGKKRAMVLRNAS